VFWWFERAAILRYEITDLPGGGYELRSSKPTAAERVEKFEIPPISRNGKSTSSGSRRRGWKPHGWNL